MEQIVPNILTEEPVVSIICLGARCSMAFHGVPGMAQFLQVKVLPRVVTAKCSEAQAAVSNDRRGGSGVAKPASLRTEIGYKAKRRVRLPLKPKPER